MEPCFFAKIKNTLSQRTGNAIVSNRVDDKIAKAAAKLRKIRELRGLTREKFCEPLNENSEYWGLIERGEQALSLGKLIQVCEVYHIPIESVIQLDYQEQDDKALRAEVVALLDDCDFNQLTVIKKFITDIATAL